MITKLWNAIGVKRTIDGLGEINYERKNIWLESDKESMLEMAYLLGSSIICGTLIWLNAISGNCLGLICSAIGTLCTMLLIPIAIDIIEGYYCSWKPLW